MANPLPFAPTSNDTVDWVKAVTPVTVSSGGTVTPASSVTPTNGGSLSADYGGITGGINLGWNDGSTHLLAGIYLSMCCMSYSGSSQVAVHAFVETNSPAAQVADLILGFQSFPSSGPLPQAQNLTTWPNGFVVPKQSAGTFSLQGTFYVLEGTGTFSVRTTFGVYWV